MSERSTIRIVSHRAKDLQHGDIVQMRVHNVDRWVELTGDARPTSAGHVTLTFKDDVDSSKSLEVREYSLVRVQVEKQT